MEADRSAQVLGSHCLFLGLLIYVTNAYAYQDNEKKKKTIYHLFTKTCLFTSFQSCKHGLMM